MNFGSVPRFRSVSDPVVISSLGVPSLADLWTTSGRLFRKMFSSQLEMS
eukprot:UN25083